MFTYLQRITLSSYQPNYAFFFTCKVAIRAVDGQWHQLAALRQCDLLRGLLPAPLRRLHTPVPRSGAEQSVATLRARGVRPPERHRGHADQPEGKHAESDQDPVRRQAETLGADIGRPRGGHSAGLQVRNGRQVRGQRQTSLGIFALHVREEQGQGCI